MALDIPTILTKLAMQHNKQFTYHGKPLPLEQVFAYDGALYVFVNRANMLADFLFGHKLQVSMVPDEKALNSERVVVDPKQQSFILVMILYDVLEEMVVNAGQGDIVLV